ncbi:hypothetical protein ABIF63_004898 [Bradyrhizobium japonicum]|uniref:Uncharacterized protein n=1 Tax=Bradyrhizobium japonicum TaxID=375 RepID=A0ABV2RWW8_BRAJP
MRSGKRTARAVLFFFGTLCAIFLEQMKFTFKSCELILSINLRHG